MDCRVPHDGRTRVPHEVTAEMARLRTRERMTLQAIGNRYGITRERVRQLLKRAGVPGRLPPLPTPIRPARICALPECGRLVPRGRRHYCCERCSNREKKRRSRARKRQLSAGQKATP